MGIDTMRVQKKDSDYFVQCYVKADLYEKFKQILIDNGIVPYGTGSKIKAINSDLLAAGISQVLSMGKKKTGEFFGKYKENYNAETCEN